MKTAFLLLLSSFLFCVGSAHAAKLPTSESKLLVKGVEVKYRKVPSESAFRICYDDEGGTSMCGGSQEYEQWSFDWYFEESSVTMAVQLDAVYIDGYHDCGIVVGGRRVNAPSCTVGDILDGLVNKGVSKKDGESLVELISDLLYPTLPKLKSCVKVTDVPSLDEDFRRSGSDSTWLYASAEFNKVYQGQLTAIRGMSKVDVKYPTGGIVTFRVKYSPLNDGARFLTLPNVDEAGADSPCAK